MIYVIAGVLLIGPIIFFHELGHLLAAKLVDVKATRFSIGFGRPFARFQFGDTEYCLAPIPLGGYVQLLGQHPYDDIPPEEADRALGAKPLWAKWFVLVAGPAANLILPLVVQFFFFLSVTHQAPPVIGSVFVDSPADEAELQPGDRIVSIDGRDMRSFRDVVRTCGGAPGEELLFQIERDGQRIPRYITPARTIRTDPNTGERVEVGRVGIALAFVRPQIGILDTTSPAYQEGLRTGDIITSINGQSVRTLADLERQLAQRAEGQLPLTYLRGVEVPSPAGTFIYYESKHVRLLPRKEREFATGILPGSTFVRDVAPGSPAAEAGIATGDRILEVNDKRIRYWLEFETIAESRGDRPLDVVVQSPGEEPRTVELTPTYETLELQFKEQYRYLFHGMSGYDLTSEPEHEAIRGRVNFAAASSWRFFSSHVSFILRGMKQMFTFQTDMKELGSVVGMVAVAGAAAERGPGEFLRIFAIINLSVALFNLIPIPVLDGGHLLLYTVESVRRRPLGQRTREIISAVGLVIVLILLLIALRNDIMRVFF